MTRPGETSSGQGGRGTGPARTDGAASARLVREWKLMERGAPVGDEIIARLARTFLEHPAWVDAARRTESGATSTVFFSHRPGEPWHLVRRGDETLLLPGAAPDPDFVFRFTPASIERLSSVGGGVGDVAVELFKLVGTDVPSLQVGFRVVASFPKLVRRGYLGVLAAGGRRVLAFGSARGVRTLADLRRLVERVRERGVQDWEVRTGAARSEDPARRFPG